jgi:hypothetical protein
LIAPSAPGELLRLRRALVRDRERDLVLLDGGIENLVVEEGGRLGFEEDPGILLFDRPSSRPRGPRPTTISATACSPGC